MRPRLGRHKAQVGKVCRRAGAHSKDTYPAKAAPVAKDRRAEIAVAGLRAAMILAAEGANAVVERAYAFERTDGI
jgi:hypothetical protein